MENVTELLKELTSAVGVSGDESEISLLLKKRLSKYGEVYSDCMNNVYCTFGSGRHYLIEAHLDEIGMVVTDITDDGFIKFSRCGGIDRRMLLGSEVSVLGKERINGIISTLPPHLQTEKDEKSVPDFKSLSIDCGFSKKELENIVSLGDKIIFRRNFTPLLNGQISSSCLDDRAGVAAILLCLDELKKLPCKVTVMFSSQEELGTRGAKIGAYGKNIDEAICVDVSFAYTPECDKTTCGELGKGAMIGFSPILNREISQRLVDTAQNHGIPYQKEIMNGTTGTNADVISINQSGVKTALISVPEKYMHQPVEVVDVNDIISVKNLICAYVGERSGECNA